MDSITRRCAIGSQAAEPLEPFGLRSRKPLTAISVPRRVLDRHTLASSLARVEVAPLDGFQYRRILATQL